VARRDPRLTSFPRVFPPVKNSFLVSNIFPTPIAFRPRGTESLTRGCRSLSLQCVYVSLLFLMVAFLVHSSSSPLPSPSADFPSFFPPSFLFVTANVVSKVSLSNKFFSRKHWAYFAVSRLLHTVGVGSARCAAGTQAIQPK